ncbi:MAG: amino acid permease [Bacteroidetes bacterium]|nr:amino acid permease [Bacteroidota bacterium]
MNETQIKPRLRVFDLSIIVISLVIGMGIFRTPSEVASKAGTPDIFFLAWIMGAIISFFGALTFAEIGSRIPSAGGFYKLFSICYNPVFAFMVNWITVISNAASTAAVAIMGSSYIAPILFPNFEEATATKIVTMGTISLLLLINLMGIKISAMLLNVLMIIKIGLILLLIGCLFLNYEIPNVPTHVSSLPANYNPLKAFVLCFIPVFFTFGGYQHTVNFGGDISNPSKTLPKAIFFGISVILILYLAVNYSYVNVLGFEHLATSKTLAADMIFIPFGKTASLMLSIVMFFAVMAYVNVSILSNPRIYYAMAEDRVLPNLFKRVNSKTQVQEFGVIFFCFIIFLTLFFMNSFQKILDYVMFFDSISLITAAGSIFILRRRAKKNQADEKSIFKLKFYPWIPILYISIYTLVNLSVFLSNKSAFGWGALLFISGFPLFFMLRKLIVK